MQSLTEMHCVACRLDAPTATDLAAAHEAGTLGPEAYRDASQRFGITWLE